MNFLLAVGLFLFAQQAPEYDVILSGGHIFDGAGNPWFTADLAIKGDTIAAIGNLSARTAALRIDARGLVVAPGFIDTHSHGRGGIFEVPLAENQIRQGVTSIVEGPDGSSPIPIKPFLEKVAEAKAAVNFGTLAGQGSIRGQVIGSKDRKATPEELEEMKQMMRQAMLDGAFGLSTGLFYIPGAFTPTEEVVEIAKVAASMGGIYTSHMRNEAAKSLDSVRETIQIGELSGIPVQITHHKIIGKGNWGLSVKTLQLVQEARARGIDVTIDQYPYTASSTGLSALFPKWALESGQKAFLERTDAPAQRARMKAEIVTSILTDRGGGDARNIVFASCSFDKSLAGKTLADISKSVEDAADVAIDLQKKGGCSMIYHAIGEEDVVRIMRYPFTMIASDGGIPVFGSDVPHPRNYGTFARVLGRYVREQKVLTLEDAIHRMTSLPATRFMIFDRGLLHEGMKADIAVFDPQTVADKSEFDKPHQYAVGFRHVFVNGKAVLLDGNMTGARPGRILYGPAKQSE
jgi:N-acyl-D-amino-acid deacylase